MSMVESLRRIEEEKRVEFHQAIERRNSAREFIYHGLTTLFTSPAFRQFAAEVILDYYPGPVSVHNPKRSAEGITFFTGDDGDRKKYEVKTEEIPDGRRLVISRNNYRGHTREAVDLEYTWPSDRGKHDGRIEYTKTTDETVVTDRSTEKAIRRTRRFLDTLSKDLETVTLK